MPTSGRRRADLLCDTSVAVALVLADHEHHAVALDEVGTATLGLAGHAAFESYSVLTRLPPPARRTPATVRRLLDQEFPASHFLSETGAASLHARLADIGISGGAVYDALVAAAAAEAEIPLLSLDPRAADTYRMLGVDCRLIG